MDERFTLVLGGTGKTGRRVAERLWARGLPVLIGSRSGTPPFDWEDRTTWAPALRGARAAYVSYYPDLAAPGAPEVVGALAAEAAAAGVERLVLLSGRGEEEAQRSEVTAGEADVDLTVVRASWFAQNFSEGYLLEPVLAGEVALPVGDVPEPFIDVDDIADVAVAALTEDGHAGRLYEVTGPRALTFAEAVGEIGRATGRAIRHVQIPLDAFAEGMASRGRAARRGRPGVLPLRRGHGRAQRRHGRRRARGARPRAAGLRRLGARDGGGRCLERCPGPALSRRVYVRGRTAGVRRGMAFEVRPVGRVESPLADREPVRRARATRARPRPGSSSTPPSGPALRDLRAGEDVLVLTWLDRARRDVLAVHPRGDATRPRRACSAPARRTGPTRSACTG